MVVCTLLWPKLSLFFSIQNSERVSACVSVQKIKGNSSKNQFKAIRALECLFNRFSSLNQIYATFQDAQSLSICISFAVRFFSLIACTRISSNKWRAGELEIDEQTKEKKLSFVQLPNSLSS